MNSKSGAFSQLAKDRKKDRLASDKFFVHVMALLGLVAAITIVYLGTSLVNPEASLASGALVIKSAPGQEASAAQAIDPAEASALSLAHLGLGWVGPLGGQVSAPASALDIGPVEAYVICQAQTGLDYSGPGTGPLAVTKAIDPSKAYALSLAHLGLGWVGPLGGQVSAPAAALDIGPVEAYVIGQAQTGLDYSGPGAAQLAVTEAIDPAGANALSGSLDS